jgi:hypothetical protein
MPRAGPSDFLVQYIESVNSDDIDYVVSFYGSTVSYYDDGFVSRAYIQNDQELFSQKWPVRSYRLSQIFSIDAGDQPGTLIAQYKIGFSVRNGRKRIDGNAVRVCTIKLTDDGFKVVSVREKVTNRE